ncbi:MAG: hypothetical protein LH647_23130 [Leptolyngbyaceae cyanobacterium CAN_BIN12]|nr:hypothetical protein [Leptolyngbyaceae cyanobacterium CAN_BIN12]
MWRRLYQWKRSQSDSVCPVVQSVSTNSERQVQGNLVTDLGQSIIAFPNPPFLCPEVGIVF